MKKISAGIDRAQATRAQRAPATIRRPAFSLVVIGVLAAVVLCCSVGLDLLQLPHDGALGIDFEAFYAAALTLRHGFDPYNWAQLGHVEAHLHALGGPHRIMGFNSYANPPLFAWAMSPLTFLPMPTAYVVWLLGMAGAILAGLVILGRSCGLCGPAWVVLLFAVTPGTVITYFLGQQTPLLLLGLAAALALLRQGRLELAGVALTVSWIKPHLLLPVALVLIVMTRWPAARRLLAGFAGASALLGAFSWLVTGGGPLFVAWGRDLVRYGNTIDTRQPDLSSLAGLYRSLVVGPWETYCALACIGAWLLLAGLAVWRTRRDAIEPSEDAFLWPIAILLSAWLLATPYAHPPDLVVLAPVLVVLLGRRLDGLADPLVRLAIGAVLAAPEADLLGFRPNYLFSYSMLVPLTMLIALRPWRLLAPPRERPHEGTTERRHELAVPGTGGRAA